MIPVLDETDGNTQGKVCAADVVLYGLNIIVPLMTAELLKVTVFAALQLIYDTSFVIVISVTDNGHSSDSVSEELK